MPFPRHPSAGLALVQPRGRALPAPTPATATTVAPIASTRDTSSPLAALGPNAHRRLHAIHPATPGQEAAATAFALALIQATALNDTVTRPLLWIQAETAAAESGIPYGPGLIALGLNPARLVIVRARTAMAVLAAAEMGLEEAGLAGVVAELPARLPADMLKLGKRLSLRAESARTPCLLLHTSPAPVEMPVASRWSVRSRPPPVSATGRTPFTPPDFTTAFDVQLTKNRFGPLGRWSLTWQSAATAPDISHTLDPTHARPSSDHPRFAFAPLPPLSEPVAAASADRSPAAARGAQPGPHRGAAA